MKWAFRAWIPRKEHRAQERLTWKADALPTELLPLDCLRLLGYRWMVGQVCLTYRWSEPQFDTAVISTTLLERITVADRGHFTFNAQRLITRCRS